MANITLKQIDSGTNTDLSAPQIFGDLTNGGNTYILKNIVYSVDGDPSQTASVDITADASIALYYTLQNQPQPPEPQSGEYTVELSKFGIKNDGTLPAATALGINNALIYAKQQGYTTVNMPAGVYCISEDNPITMPDNITLDLKQSTFKINPNGKQKTTIVIFTGCTGAKLINGILEGDRAQHDYNTLQGSHEWNCAVTFEDCESCILDSVTVQNAAGYGVYTNLGKNISDLAIGVTTSNLQVGGISDSGVLNSNTGTIRTIQPMNVSNVGGEFELGYNKGYMGYPYMNSKIYDSFFYDQNMKFISSIKQCYQYKKVSIPDGTFYVQFVFYQATVPTQGDTDFSGTTVFLTNYKMPYKLQITNCLIQGNRCLGMGLCGGREMLIKDNTLSNNGGGDPGYAIDMEDGWEYMYNYTFQNNNFVNNTNDVVICAGDNIVFIQNHFTSTVYMWGRTTNYRFLNNKFENISQVINYEYSTDTIITGNSYIGCSIIMSNLNNTAKFIFGSETLNNSSVNQMVTGVELQNSSISSDANANIRLDGVFRSCTINCQSGDYISAKLYACKIQGTTLNCQGDTSFDGCEFVNTVNLTTNNTSSIKATNCKITNSSFLVNTWGDTAVIDIENSTITMQTGTNSLVNISAGKMANLIFLNNKVTDQIQKPVFNMYDTTYTTPNGKATVQGNTFTMKGYAYVFDGVNITSGTFIFTASNNTITGAVMLSPKYQRNRYFIIK